MNKRCVNILDDALTPKSGSLSIERVLILISTGRHNKDYNCHLANHNIKFKGNNKLRHKAKKIKDPQTRIMLEDKIEQIDEILYVILANNTATMPRNVHKGIFNCEGEPYEDKRYDENIKMEQLDI